MTETKSRTRLPLGAALASVCAMLLLTASPAGAQDINQRVERLQRELNDLQAYVYRGGTVSEDGTASTGEPLSGNAAARFDQRIGELEESLRALTGQIEEMRFKIDRTSERLDKLVEDVDFRLRELEQRQSVAGAGQSASGGQASGQQQSGSAPQTNQPGTLGTISEDDLEALQSEKVEQGIASEDQAGESQTASVELPQGSEQEQYDYAFGLLRQANFAAAEDAFKSFLAEHPDSSLASNAKYWLGETYYVRGDFRSAAVNFAEGVKNYPGGGKAPDNLLKLGMSLGKLGQSDNACATLDELRTRYPNAPANIQQNAQMERQRLGCQ